MEMRVPSDIALLEEEEERWREQEDGRWWMDWMCGCKESGGRGHGQVCRLLPWFTVPDPLMVLCRQAGPTRSNDSRLHLRIAVIHDRIFILTYLSISDSCDVSYWEFLPHPAQYLYPIFSEFFFSCSASTVGRVINC